MATLDHPGCNQPAPMASTQHRTSCADTAAGLTACCLHSGAKTPAAAKGKSGGGKGTPGGKSTGKGRGKKQDSEEETEESEDYESEGDDDDWSGDD